MAHVALCPQSYHADAFSRLLTALELPDLLEGLLHQLEHFPRVVARFTQFCSPTGPEFVVEGTNMARERGVLYLPFDLVILL